MSMVETAAPIVHRPALIPFAQIPLAMISDPKLKPADVAVAGCIVRWLGKDGTGWTAVKTIADAVGVSTRNVQRSLARLLDHDWFAVESTGANRTGRKFIALWMDADGLAKLQKRLAGCQPLVAMMTTSRGDTGGARPILLNEYSIRACASDPLNTASTVVSAPAPETTDQPPETSNKSFACGDLAPRDEIPPKANAPERKSHGNPSPKCESSLGEGCGEGADFADDPDTAALFAQAARDVRGLGSPGERRRCDRTAAGATAEHVADMLGDFHSKDCWRKVLGEVARGMHDPEWVIEAWRQAMMGSTTGRVANAGAYALTLIRQGVMEDFDRRLAEESQDQRGRCASPPSTIPPAKAPAELGQGRSFQPSPHRR